MIDVMCRYAQGRIYKTHWVCTRCRVSFKYLPDYVVVSLLDASIERIEARRCPHCGLAMIDADRDLAVPRKADRAGWRTLVALLERGVRFHSCGCTGPGYRPRTPGQLRRWAPT